jgi:hypothetical protein
MCDDMTYEYEITYENNQITIKGNVEEALNEIL